MAKQAPAPIKEEWSNDEITALAQDVSGIGESVEKLRVLLTSMDERLRANEKSLAAIDVEDRTLPNDVVAGLSPSQIFAAALTGAVMGAVQQMPTLAHAPEAVKRTHAVNAINFANQVLTELLRMSPQKKKAS